MKQNPLFFFGVLAAVLVLALIFTSRSLRENLTGVQTLALTDIQNKTPAFQTAVTKLLPIMQSLNLDADTQQKVLESMPSASTVYTSLTSTPTQDVFTSQLTGGQFTTFAAAPQMTQQIVTVLYQYFFGPSATPSTPPTSTPSPSSTPGTTPSSIPSPTSCNPAYTSVPGGTMEYKCFTS